METIKVGVSNHHIHLTEKDLFTLFGEGYKLTNKRDLVQKGQFACEETVTLERDGKILEHIRIIGPCRSYTQVELLDRDNEYFGIKAPVRTSGDLAGSEWIKGQTVKVRYENGVVLDDVHIKSDPTCVLELHMNKDEAESLGIETGMSVEIC